MTVHCKYCGNTQVHWVQPFLDKPEIWVLMHTGTNQRHLCKEFMPNNGKNNTKKIKHGVFLRKYKDHAVMIQTKAPESDTPEGVYKEINDEPRKPVFYYLAQKAKNAPN